MVVIWDEVLNQDYDWEEASDDLWLGQGARVRAVSPLCFSLTHLLLPRYEERKSLSLFLRLFGGKYGDAAVRAWINSPDHRR